MAHNVNRIGLEPLPKVKAVYVPESQTLYIENGRLREDAEEMAENILVYPGLSWSITTKTTRRQRWRSALTALSTCSSPSWTLSWPSMA